MPVAQQKEQPKPPSHNITAIMAAATSFNCIVDNACIFTERDYNSKLNSNTIASLNPEVVYRVKLVFNVDLILSRADWLRYIKGDDFAAISICTNTGYTVTLIFPLGIRSMCFHLLKSHRAGRADTQRDCGHHSA
jgi:hypothetical protein